MLATELIVTSAGGVGDKELLIPTGQQAAISRTCRTGSRPS